MVRSLEASINCNEEEPALVTDNLIQHRLAHIEKRSLLASGGNESEESEDGEPIRFLFMEMIPDRFRVLHAP